MKFSIIEWKPRRSGGLYGYVTVAFDGYLQIRDIAIRDGKNGLWAALPSTSWEGQDGKRRFTPMATFADKAASYRFSDALIEQLRQRHPEDFD